MDSLGTSNWCEDPNLWVCHYYQQSLHKWQPTDVLSRFHPKIWILKSVSLSLLTYAPIPWHKGKGYKKNIFLENLKKFMTQIISSQKVFKIKLKTPFIPLRGVWMNRTKKWTEQNVTLCLLTCDRELHCLSSVGRLHSSCIKWNWKRV